jgi:uncharacterized SAM-binding protein YcdF (DUF218 family)
MKTRLPQRLLLALLVCVAVPFVVGLLAAREVGSWLVVVDRLVTSDAIFVLDGKSPHRELEAAVLFREGWAPRVVISRPRSDVAEEVRRAFNLPPEQEGVLRLLRRAGVPEGAIIRLDPIVDNTLQELEVDFDYARTHGFRRVIIVSSPYHTRRIRLIWRTRFDREVPAVIRATRYETVAPTRWWRSRRTIQEVTHEIAAIAHFFIGSPIPTFDRGE